MTIIIAAIVIFVIISCDVSALMHLAPIEQKIYQYQEQCQTL